MLVVTVSILPQAYFVDRIGGDYVETNVMVDAGDDPHSYEPTPEQMRALSESAAYFRIGVEFENAWMDKIASANEAMRIVDTTAGIERLPMATHSHGEEEEHAEEGHDEHEEGLDPHVWTSPELVKVQSQIIYETLADLDPGHQQAYKTNLDAFLADINLLEADLHETLRGVSGHKFIVFHPSWGYFARDFGLEQVPVEVGGQEPSARELAALIAEAREEGAHIVFAQPEFSTRAAETIADEIDGEVLLISPLAYDWLENMRSVATTFASTLGQ
jgi:zinc transport system substrate-binding protein